MKLKNKVNIISMISVQMFFLFSAATPCYTFAQSGEVMIGAEASGARRVSTRGVLQTLSAGHGASCALLWSG